jgi:outer membrane protein assembly factor BamB
MKADASFRTMQAAWAAWAVAILSASGVARAEIDWPEWRGPGAQGQVRGASARQLPVRWSETNHVTWKTAIPGRGWSSPVINAEHIWLTTAVETPATPEDRARRLKENTGDQPLNLLERVEYRAIRVNRRSGRIEQSILVFEEREPQWVHQLNSYASPSPVLEAGRLYAHFGAAATVALDTETLRVLWTNTTLRIQHENGPGSSPLLWRDSVILHMDGSDHQYVVALDKKTGKVRWKTDRTGAMSRNPQLKKSYATPLVLPLDGRDQLISPGPDWLYSYDPATGRELWKLKFGNQGFSLSARMVVDEARMYFSTGFMRPEMLAVEAKGKEGQPPAIAWRYTKGVPTMSSPVLVGTELYFVSDSGGMLTCLDATTGREHYRERLGGDHNASLLAADGRIYVLGRSGATDVIAAGKEFKRLARNQLEGRQMASPAVADGALFIRTDSALYRIESRASADSSSP